MATVQARLNFYWKGAVVLKEQTFECSDEDARSLAHDGKVSIVSVSPQTVQTVQTAPQLVGPVEEPDPKPEAG